MSLLSSEFSLVRVETLPGDENCGICLGDFNNHDLIVAHTGTITHLFHKACLNTWTKQHSSCPLCRRNITKIDKESIEARIDNDKREIIDFLERNALWVRRDRIQTQPDTILALESLRYPIMAAGIVASSLGILCAGAGIISGIRERRIGIGEAILFCGGFTFAGIGGRALRLTLSLSSLTEEGLPLRRQ